MSVAPDGGRERIHRGLARTREALLRRLGTLFRRGSPTEIDPAVHRVEEALLLADVSPSLCATLMGRVHEMCRSCSGEEDGSGLLRRLLVAELERILRPMPGGRGTWPPERPAVFLVVGSHGVGKTTTVGKLAFRFRREGKRVLLAGSDTRRAAAGEQVAVWAERAGADLVTQQEGADAAAVVHDALQAAVSRSCDLVLVDTAGRLHSERNPMEDLRKVHRVAKKVVPGAPHESLLVIDATTGQNGLRQAADFREAAGVTGIVLTKLDGTARGGIALSIRHELGIPVSYLGVGEGIGDLIEFDPRAYLEALLGGAASGEGPGPERRA